MPNYIKYLGPATWAYAIILGGTLLLTPAGIVSIVTNPAFIKMIGGLGVALGVAGFYYRASSQDPIPPKEPLVRK